MKKDDFTRTIMVDQSPEEVFSAINNVRGWWSENIEGETDRLNAEFNYHYKDVHICRLKIVEFVPGEKITWLVVNNYFNFTRDKSEWTGSKICFDISGKGQQSQIRFTHLGLVPQYECYEVCADAWGNYISGSLRNLITTGKGEPNPKGEVGEFNEALIKKWNLEGKAPVKE